MARCMLEEQSFALPVSCALAADRHRPLPAAAVVCCRPSLPSAGKLSQYPVIESHHLPLSLPLSAAIHCCLPPLNHRSPPQAHRSVKMTDASSVSQGSTGIVVENFAMVASRDRGRSGRGTREILRNGKGGHGRLICLHWKKKGHLQNRCYDLIGWQDKTANISSSDTPSNGRTDSQLISDEVYQEFLRLKSNNHTQ
ncbi:hypothetical protein CR513_41087, partial [Mucuna pruriens]